MKKVVYEEKLKEAKAESPRPPMKYLTLVSVKAGPPLNGMATIVLTISDEAGKLYYTGFGCRPVYFESIQKAFGRLYPIMMAPGVIKTADAKRTISDDAKRTISDEESEGTEIDEEKEERSDSDPSSDLRTSGNCEAPAE